MQENKRPGSETLTGIISVVFSAIGLMLFMLSFSTGYYTFGQMNSWLVLIFILLAIVVEAIALGIGRKFDNKLWSNLITYVVTGCLAAGAILLVGDRVEGIGNCIVTDYDSGHGGEQAIYASIGGAVALLIAMIYNIIGSFMGNKDAADAGKKIRNRIIAFGVSAVLLFAAVFVPTMSMTGYLGGASDASGAAGGEVYKVTYSQNNGNADEGVFPNYQFLCSDFSGLVRADARFMVDVELTLSKDSYTIKSDAYVMESGKRAEIGDDTGLGLILTMEATGTYTKNEDGTVTTSVPEHAVFEMETDTYSSQMKEAVQMNVNGATDDGVYDSNDEPAVLDFVPETIWTLKDGTIESYRDANAGEEPKQEETSKEEKEPEEEKETEEEAQGEDAADASAEAGGNMIKSDDGSTRITFRSDGTYVFEFPDYNVSDEGTYTYDGTKLVVTNANKNEMTAEGNPLKLHYVSSMSDALTGDFTIEADKLQ